MNTEDRATAAEEFVAQVDAGVDAILEHLAVALETHVETISGQDAATLVRGCKSNARALRDQRRSPHQTGSTTTE